MIGLQKLIIDNNIRTEDLANEIGVANSTIWAWINRNKVSKQYINALAKKFNVREEYINEIVNDINTYIPKVKNFNDYIIEGNVVKLIVKKRKGINIEFIIDLDDFDKIRKIPYWGAAWYKCPSCYYIKAEINGKSILLHRYILGIEDKYEVVDHINHDTLDNRKINLRVTNIQNNSRHREKKNKNNKSGYRNVCWIDDQWCVQLHLNGKNVRLGYFNDVHEAGRFAKEMRNKYYGKYQGDS